MNEDRRLSGKIYTSASVPMYRPFFHLRKSRFIKEEARSIRKVELKWRETDTRVMRGRYGRRGKVLFKSYRKDGKWTLILLPPAGQEE